MREAPGFTEKVVLAPAVEPERGVPVLRGEATELPVNESDDLPLLGFLLLSFLCLFDDILCTCLKMENYISYAQPFLATSKLLLFASSELYETLVNFQETNSHACTVSTLEAVYHDVQG